MIQRSIILEKSKTIDRCRARIDHFISGDCARIDDQTVEDIFVLYLQRMCQLCIDIAAHIIRDEGMELPSSMRDYFLVLESKQFVSHDLAQRLAKMVGFRNVAVHDYVKISKDILKSICRTGLDDIKAFQQQVLAKLH